jgi:hypothetical protein
MGAGGDEILILKTTDGGITWKEIQIPDIHHGNVVKSLHFISDLTGFAAGAPTAFIPEGPTSFFISKTINGGNSWEIYDTIGIPLNSVFFINDTIGFVSGSYNLIMKSNGKISGLPADYPWYLPGIGDYLEENEMIHSTIYPNPTDGMIWIKQIRGSQQVNSIKLLTVAGHLIRILEPLGGNELMRIDVTDLPPGMYLIQIIYPDSTELFKILKK